MEETKPEAVVPVATSSDNEETSSAEVKQEQEPMDTDVVATQSAEAPAEQEGSSVKSEPVDGTEDAAPTPVAKVTPTVEKVKEEAPEVSEPIAGPSKRTVPAPRTPKTPKVNKAAAGTQNISRFFTRTPKTQEKAAVKEEVVDPDLEVIEVTKKRPAEEATPKRTTPKRACTAKTPPVKATVKNKPEPEHVEGIEEAVEKKESFKLAPIGYFSSLEKLIEVCKKFYGPYKIPLSSMIFDNAYEEDDELLDEAVKDILSGVLTEDNLDNILGAIAEKDHEAKKTAEHWSVLILENQHLISAVLKLKTSDKAPQWVKNDPELIVELVGVPNSLFTSYCKKFEDYQRVELKTAMIAVFYEEGKKEAPESQILKAVRELATMKKADAEKQWNSFINQGVLQSRGSNLKYVFLMGSAPAELFDEFRKIVRRNTKSEYTDKIVDTVLEFLALKCLQCKNDTEGLVKLLKTINSAIPVLKPAQIVEIIKAFKPEPLPQAEPAPVEEPAEAPRAPSPKKAAPPRKRKARSSGANSRTKPQVKKERVEEDDEETVSNNPMQGSEAQVVSADSGSEVKSEVAEPEPMEVISPAVLPDSASEASVKDEFEVPDVDFDPTSLPDNVTLIPTPLTCAVFTQVETKKEDNICIWTNDLDPDIITTAHLNSSKIIVLAEKVETFEDEEVVEYMKLCKAETADFTVQKGDDNVIHWSFICFGKRAIPDGVRNKLFQNFREVEKIVQKSFEEDSKNTTSMVRFANDDLLSSLSKQLTNTVIGCNYIRD